MLYLNVLLVDKVLVSQNVQLQLVRLLDALIKLRLSLSQLVLLLLLFFRVRTGPKFCRTLAAYLLLNKELIIQFKEDLLRHCRLLMRLVLIILEVSAVLIFAVIAA